jgi:hypothetical protein
MHPGHTLSMPWVRIVSPNPPIQCGHLSLRAQMAVGVHGYLLKTASGPELIEAVRAIHRGKRMISAGRRPSLAGIRQYAALLCPMPRWRGLSAPA